MSNVFIMPVFFLFHVFIQLSFDARNNASCAVFSPHALRFVFHRRLKTRDRGRVSKRTDGTINIEDLARCVGCSLTVVRIQCMTTLCLALNVHGRHHLKMFGYLNAASVKKKTNKQYSGWLNKILKAKCYHGMLKNVRHVRFLLFTLQSTNELNTHAVV